MSSSMGEVRLQPFRLFLGRSHLSFLSMGTTGSVVKILIKFRTDLLEKAM